MDESFLLISSHPNLREHYRRMGGKNVRGGRWGGGLGNANSWAWHGCCAINHSNCGCLHNIKLIGICSCVWATFIPILWHVWQSLKNNIRNINIIGRAFVTWPLRSCGHFRSMLNSKRREMRFPDGFRTSRVHPLRWVQWTKLSFKIRSRSSSDCWVATK